MEENLTPQPEIQEKPFVITENCRQYLDSIGRWLKFFYVIAIVAIVFLAIMGFAYIFAGEQILEEAYVGVIAGVIVLLMDGLAIYLTHCLGKAANNIKASLKGKDELVLEEGFRYIKKFLKTYGIITIALLAIYALVIVIAIIAAIIGFLL